MFEKGFAIAWRRERREDDGIDALMFDARAA